MCGNGPRNSRTKAGPATEAGKSFTAEAPARQAARISVGVKAPGRNGIPRSTAHSISSGSTCGDTRKVAPASMARSAASSRQHGPRADLERRALGVASGRAQRRERLVLGLIEGQLEGSDAAAQQAVGDVADRRPR